MLHNNRNLHPAEKPSWSSFIKIDRPYLLVHVVAERRYFLFTVVYLLQLRNHPGTGKYERGSVLSYSLISIYKLVYADQLLDSLALWEFHVYMIVHGN